MTVRPTNNFIAEIKSTEIHRRQVRVVELNEVVVERALRNRKPFVNFQPRRITEGSPSVGSAESGNIQSPGTIIHAPDRKIGQLRTVFHRVEQRAAIG